MMMLCGNTNNVPRNDQIDELFLNVQMTGHFHQSKDLTGQLAILFQAPLTTATIPSVVGDNGE